MIHTLYTLIIFPIELIIELGYVLIFRLFNNHALAILGVSFFVSTITLPLYFMAEKLQQKERDIQKKMKADVDNIKTVFKGDERYMRLSTYYRQNGYHPLYALRSSISLLIQIPFFIAAFHFLSNLEIIQGVSFGPIQNLGAPDTLFAIGSFSINVLPILMTLINFASAAIYTRGLSTKDKTQLYGMALVFLVLLYNSPAVMVLYWTGNNFFSLIKNIIQKSKYPKQVILILASAACFPMAAYILFIHGGAIIKRAPLAAGLAVVPVGLFLFSKYARFWQVKTKVEKINFDKKPDSKSIISIFVLSMLALFLLAGLVIPSSLIETSVQQFSFIGVYTSPFPFIGNALLQAFGIFILWPLCIFFMVPQKIKKIFAVLAPIITGIVLVNVFLFTGNYGDISVIFRFPTNQLNSTFKETALNIVVMLFITAGIFLMTFSSKKKILQTVLTITLCAFVILSTVNCVRIYHAFNSFAEQLRYEARNRIEDEAIFSFSQTGKNILIITLDMAISGYLPYIFNERPELYDSFDGFVWYKNAISFGGHTIFGMPGIFGGYEYTPLEMQRRDDVRIVDKHNEALLMLPKILLENDFRVTITDPPFANYSWFADLSIFNDYPDIRAQNIIGRFTNKWFADNPALLLTGVDEVIKINLIRFSAFRFAPLLFRNFIYDRGNWLSTVRRNIPLATLNNYITLDILPDISVVQNDYFNTYNVIYNDLPHFPWFLQYPDYTLPHELSSSIRGNGPFANEERYHVNMASFLLLAKWFDYLKENGVYENTRIIIVSDHGFYLQSDFEENITLPNGVRLQAYAALLMIKDFDAEGKLSVNDTFMTNADVPLIVLESIVEKPHNPWTGNLLEADKDSGTTITTSTLWSPARHPGNTFNIMPDEWLHVHTNIFDPDNWTRVRIE